MRPRALLLVATAVLVAVPFATATTERTAAMPSSTTNGPSNLAATTVTLNGKATLTCAGSRGFKLAYPDHTATISNAAGAGTSSYTANAIGLTPGTSYAYYAFASDCNGTAVGNPTTFTTNAIVNVTMSGAGKLSGGIACSSSCSVNVENGKSLSVTATANAGSRFSGWTGLCAGQGATCTATPTGTATLGVTFVAIHGLTVAKAGDGAGTVTSGGGEISCGSVCSASFASGAGVTLTATPAAGSVFSGWSGACAGAAATCTVSLGSDQAVTATFARERKLSVGVHGRGAVISAPTGIACINACSALFAPNAAVTLTATPEDGWRFIGWSGPCGGTGACSLTLGSDTTVNADFRPLFTLRVVTVGGRGTVRSAPNGILCGSACSKAFLQGAVVTLRASAAKGYRFTGWAGDCKGSKTTCRVTMRQGRAVVALYAKR
jgi:hypothetical protein